MALRCASSTSRDLQGAPASSGEREALSCQLLLKAQCSRPTSSGLGLAVVIAMRAEA